MILLGRAAPPPGLPVGLHAERFLREQFHREQARRERDFLRSRGIRDPQLDAFLDIEKRKAAIAIDGTAALSATGSGSTTNRSVTGRTVAANSLVVLIAKWEDDTAPTIAMTVDGTSHAGVSSWTYGTVATNSPSNNVLLQAAWGISSGYSGSVRVNWASGVPFGKLAFIAFSGIDTSTPLDSGTPAGGGVNSGESAGSTVAAITNASAEAVYVYGDGRYGGGAFSGLTFGGAAGSEAWDDSDTLGGGYLVVASSASRGGAQTGPNTVWATVMLAFRAASAGATSYLPRGGINPVHLRS